MRTSRLILFVIISSLAITTCAHAKYLTKAELHKLFPGNYTVIIYRIFSINVTMGKHGELQGLSRAKRDTGRWSIEGNKFCLLWKNWTDGKKGCSALKRDNNVIVGDGFYFKI